MEDEDMYSSGTPSIDTPEVDEGAYDQQLASLRTYLKSVPYECEAVEDMQAKLEYIVGRIAVCAKTKNWLVLTTWDGMLQCWLLMRYPISKVLRAKIVRLYYELCLLPGIEPRVIRSWADMLSRLLSNKPGMRRKLEAWDLQLSWQDLWKVLQKELWPKKRILDSSRNVINILLYVAELCQRYYPADEIQSMLSTFLPLFTKDTYLTMIPVVTSFLPPTHCHLYLPPLLKIWEAFNSTVVDDRFLELVGDLSEEHIAGPEGDAGEEGGARWKDVGIWTQEQWTFLMGKALGSMNVPVGATRGASTTGAHADSMADRQSLRIKKAISRPSALAKMIIYSMSVDGPVREDGVTPPSGSESESLAGYLAGSRALDSLDRLITSTESFFHPSNSGPWTTSLTGFLHRLASEFSRRWNEERQDACKTPAAQRLTPAIRRAFVNILRTPALLAMFSKDQISMSYAQGTLRALAFLEPNVIMPELLERAYSGLEVVNETHRTTAVLSMLSGVSLPLVSESIWLGGQKHVVPLLELCLPGIDLNDHVKTVCAAMFIVATVQHMKIGDLSIHQSGLPLTGDAPPEEQMDVDVDARLPDSLAAAGPTLDRDEERALVRESTAGFADWVTALFRRVLALFENLPEEGGKRGTTGGKQEENVLKSIKSTLDVVCLHLSDQLFDLVLKLVYDYGTTNAKSNAVRAFGQLVACLARVKPQETMDKFFPFCAMQIREELKHGASSVRTTSAHTAVPSDTTLHWNLSILRGCLGYGGSALLKHRKEVLDLLSLLVEKTKNERGYNSTGRLITRIMHTLIGVYPLNSRFVNTEQWNDPGFNQDHNVHWGQLYESKDIEIEWHVPGDDEIQFVLEIIDTIGATALSKVESLLESSGGMDNILRNDFCRYINVARSIWSGLSTFYKEGVKEVANPCIDDETEVAGLLVTSLDVNAGFTLTDPSDPRYRKAAEARARYGRVIHLAAQALRGGQQGEDHIDAVVAVAKSIDVFLLNYGMTRGNFDSLQKNFAQARELHRMWPKQRQNSRLVWVKRAQVYHSGRVYMHALYRRRSELDDTLLHDLVELSLSPYTRVRRQSQAILHNTCGYYVRSTRFILPTLFNALGKGNDPDRMKGALYVLWNKGIASYTLADRVSHGKYLSALLECQHQEKPSIQQLVASLAHDCLVHLSEEAVHTDSYAEETPAIDAILNDLEVEFTSTIDEDLLKEAAGKAGIRASARESAYQHTLSSILSLALKPTTHWRYVQMAIRFMYGLLRRDAHTPPMLAQFLLEHTVSPHATIRAYSQRAVVKLCTFVKMRTYAKTSEELWLEQWRSPLLRRIPVEDEIRILQFLQYPPAPSVSQSDPYVDKIETGFFAWTGDIKAYLPAAEVSSFPEWELHSKPALEVMDHAANDAYFQKLAELWSQESNKNGGTTDLRSDNAVFAKTLTKMLGGSKLDSILSAIDPLLSDADKFKQRGGGEMLVGLWRGSKHWPKIWSEKLWSWTMTRLDRIFSQIKPDTLPFWESVFTLQLADWDPRRNRLLVDWILKLPLEFHGDSAFEMSKTLSMFAVLVDCLGPRFSGQADRYFELCITNANTGYAEIRAHIAQLLYVLLRSKWQPAYSSADAFVQACVNSDDPLHIREAPYLDRLSNIVEELQVWKEERLPPPRVSQSQYDKVGLTLLQWIWVSSYGPQACMMFPYITVMLPEILAMTELSDSSELQTYSSAVLYVLSAVTPPVEYIEKILDVYVGALKSAKSWRVRLNVLPSLVVFFFRNLLTIPDKSISAVMDVLLACLADENVEVREMSSKVLSGLVRCSQRQKIVPLKNRFVALARKTKLPNRQDSQYADLLRTLHSAILGLCALLESFPYSVEKWMPSLTEVLARHSTDPPPVSTTIRKCASEFKKTHQDTWHKDQQAFNEDQLQDLSTMLVGTSYCESVIRPAAPSAYSLLISPIGRRISELQRCILVPQLVDRDLYYDVF
ncbi:ARM repeat-containing protein [Heliocybe sulcata]|uniref:ARM repeat-containing protein n=1 Tax=Heliocybe sulcata TaxID=5364 RepID=A0A5C3NJU9_9AGAM|nr:ARM repeat-containing protein [Heliocybe sulcata]